MERNDEMLANTLDAAGVRAEYDSNVKNILSNKRVLAWILKSTAREFMDFSIDEIIGRIESDPQVQRISLLPHAVIPGETANGSELITGMAQESNIPNEGQITYDVRFSAFGINDEKAQVMLFVDLEAQKDPTPGYDIVTRGIFYCARMLSEQYGTTFTAPDYDKLEKVYSIWIVKNCSEKEANTISLYRWGVRIFMATFQITREVICSMRFWYGCRRMKENRRSVHQIFTACYRRCFRRPCLPRIRRKSYNRNLIFRFQIILGGRLILCAT